MMKHHLLLLILTLSSTVFAANEGHSTGGIADNRPVQQLPAEETHRKIIATKEFNTSKIDLTKNVNPTSADQTGMLNSNVKVPHTPATETPPAKEFKTASPNGAVITNF